MGTEVILGVIASAVTISTGIGWVLDRNGRRIDSRFDTIITHMAKIEEVLDKVRTELPVKYTLKDDHNRLVDKVEAIQNDMILWRHKETR